MPSADSRHPPLHVPFAALLLLAAAHAPALAAVFRVGPMSDPACTHQSIAAALVAWENLPTNEPTWIQISRGQSYSAQALTITPTPTSQAVYLEGGFADCSAVGSDGERLVLDGGGGSAAPVIAIDAMSASRLTVALRTLEIRGGDPASGDGGGVRVRGAVDLEMSDVTVRDNVAERGGGLSLASNASGAPALTLLGGSTQPSLIVGNMAGEGGGIHCASGRVTLDRYTAVNGNIATGNGGGLALFQCPGLAYMGALFQPDDPAVGIQDNQAGGDGGGAWVDGGAFSTGIVGEYGPFAVSGNHADGDGGGFWIRNAPVSASGGRFDDNSAGGNGGAVALLGTASLYVGPSVDNDPCRDGYAECTRLRRNRAAQGGAIFAGPDSTSISLFRLLIEDNEAGAGSVLHAANPAMIAIIDTAQIRGNHGATELVLAAGGTLNLRYVTMSGNGADDTALVRMHTAGYIGLHGAVLHDDNSASSGTVLDVPTGTQVSGACVLVHEDASITAHGSVAGLVVGDPMWDVDELPYLVPGANSAAIDACVDTLADTDLRGRLRPLDLPDAPNGVGANDMGAIERQRPRSIFASGFEDA